MGDGDFTTLPGTEFERAELGGARFTAVSLNGATSVPAVGRDGFAPGCPPRP